ncbi:2-dehydro-3-deoxygluconokinase [Alteromonas sp. KUL42]|uniref:sugar kinase n=1 Tax=Alteromonas sp. KUL42 TaxID=2480797 RepID=UPI001036D6C0|nr:sugar kinase [Alteromonas sp. KUL42]TAP32739.1 sugar kinase [Alteromonas sp. KUL42]GEA07893.1 2-dehydro-3-deoxygluconokinase [Alteromonas sp. KUL42]
MSVKAYEFYYTEFKGWREREVKVAIIGECMIELSNSDSELYKLNYGGDTLNTAIYLSRCGGDVEYVTALGDDSFSSKMLSLWQEEGVGVKHVKTLENNVPGLYLIENEPNGERHFHYWRSNSPAKYLLDKFPETLDEIKDYDAIFLSGITLSIYSESTRKALYDFLSEFRMRGGKVIFDNNYRERNWLSLSEASKAFNQIMNLTDLALLSMEDEVSLHGEHSMEYCIERWLKCGVSEVIVKNGASGILAANKDGKFEFDVPNVVDPVDTTAAGDSFNGAFLAAKAKGESLEKCIRDGQFCAAQVIMHKGAIVPKSISLKGA